MTYLEIVFGYKSKRQEKNLEKRISSRNYVCSLKYNYICDCIFYREMTFYKMWLLVEKWIYWYMTYYVNMPLFFIVYVNLVEWCSSEKCYNFKYDCQCLELLFIFL